MRLPRWATQAAHLVYGVITAFSPGILPIVLFLSFYIYELVEFYFVRDEPYIDMVPYMIGLGTGVACRILGT